MVDIFCQYCIGLMVFGANNDACRDLWNYRYANNLCVICEDEFQYRDKIHHVSCERQGYPLHYVTHG